MKPTIFDVMNDGFYDWSANLFIAWPAPCIGVSHRDTNRATDLPVEFTILYCVYSTILQLVAPTVVALRP